MNSLVVAVALVFALSGFDASSQDEKPPPPTDILERAVPGDELQSLTTFEALMYALSSTGVPGGIASTTGCEHDSLTQRWMPRGSRLEDVLDSIVYSDQRYRWYVDIGVVNLIPADREPAMLSTPIRSFHLDEPADVDTALELLLELPEVKNSESSLGFRDAVRLIVGPISTKPKITLSLQNVTLREALNSLVRAHGRAVWAYRERSCAGTRSFRVDFIVK